MDLLNYFPLRIFRDFLSYMHTFYTLWLGDLVQPAAFMGPLPVAYYLEFNREHAEVCS